MRPLKVGWHSSEYVAQAVVLLRETDSVLIGFDSGDVEARVASGREKISGAAAHIEQAAIFRRLGIAQEKNVAGLQRHHGAVAPLIRGFIPRCVRHFQRMPKLQIAAGASIQRGLVRMRQRRRFRRAAARGAVAGSARSAIGADCASAGLGAAWLMRE